MSDENLPAEIERDPQGRFLKGARSANPLGRKKGTRNWIIEQRMAFESALRDYVAHPQNAKKFLAAIDNLMDIASNHDGCIEPKDSVGAIKILTDHFMNTTTRPSEEEGGPKGPRTVRVVIENHTQTPAGVIIEQPIEAEDAEYVETPADSDGDSSEG